jgi:hypothetical protein
MFKIFLQILTFFVLGIASPLNQGIQDCKAKKTAKKLAAFENASNAYAFFKPRIF